MGVGRLPHVWDRADALELGLARLREARRPVVLVPTMGDLHEGHLSLVRLGSQIGPTVVSIFVNPTQFGPNEDYKSYPRDLERDVALLAAEGAAGVYAPGPEEVYPPGDRTFVEVESRSDSLCGRSRPGHFRGVTTVVAKLFAAVRPDVAMFGQKDAQQCLVIDRMVRDLRIPVRLVFGPTVREPDGLAMSSRNRYLLPDQRRDALKLHRALRMGQDRLEAGERDVSVIEAAMAGVLSGGDCKLDYAELRAVPELEHLDRAEGRVLLAVAAYVGPARLIDNVCLYMDTDEVRVAPLLEEASPEALVVEPRKDAGVG